MLQVFSENKRLRLAALIMTTLPTIIGVNLPSQIVVELRVSNRCQGNWVKADVPKGTKIYLKGEQGQEYVPYTTQVAGANYGDMMNWNPPYKACAKLPEGREVCTQLVR